MTSDACASLKKSSTGRSGPIRVRAIRVTANYLTILRAGPVLGRDFLAEEEQPGRSNVAILNCLYCIIPLEPRLSPSGR